MESRQIKLAISATKNVEVLRGELMEKKMNYELSVTADD